MQGLLCSDITPYTMHRSEHPLAASACTAVASALLHTLMRRTVKRSFLRYSRVASSSALRLASSARQRSSYVVQSRHTRCSCMPQSPACTEDCAVCSTQATRLARTQGGRKKKRNSGALATPPQSACALPRVHQTCSVPRHVYLLQSVAQSVPSAARCCRVLQTARLCGRAAPVRCNGGQQHVRRVGVICVGCTAWPEQAQSVLQPLTPVVASPTYLEFCSASCSHGLFFQLLAMLLLVRLMARLCARRSDGDGVVWWDQRDQRLVAFYNHNTAAFALQHMLRPLLAVAPDS